MTKQEYQDELTGKYLECMREIKRRTLVLQMYASKTITAVYVATTAECMALQFRKILEKIALASLVANREEYERVAQDFSKHWHAKRIFASLRKANPDFYPKPTRPEQKKKGELDYYDLKERPGHLTVAEFIELHDLCCELLHATNPYSSDEQKYEDLIGSAQTWLRKIMELLSHHAIGPSGTDLMFIVQMGHENQNPSLTVFRKCEPGEEPEELKS